MTNHNSYDDEVAAEFVADVVGEDTIITALQCVPRIGVSDDAESAHALVAAREPVGWRHNAAENSVCETAKIQINDSRDACNLVYPVIPSKKHVTVITNGSTKRRY